MKNNIASFWTEERLERLKTLHAEGKSATQIFALMGAQSRNAVCGKIHRLGLSAPPRAPKQPRAPRKSRAGEHHLRARIVDNGRRLEVHKVKFSAEEIKLRCVEIECVTPFADVTGCMYPADGDGPILFCNGPRAEHSSYCFAHHALCWVPARARVVKHFPGVSAAGFAFRKNAGSAA